MISFANEIIRTISHYNDGQFDTIMINNYIVEIKDNITGNYKYIIFEPQSIYLKIDELTKFFVELDEAKFKSEHILRLPFFAGCSGYDLGDFLLNQTTSIGELDIPINFSILPADFNSYGLNRFLNYVDTLKSVVPIFKGNNNFTSYISYFEKVIEEKDDKILQVIPITFIKRSTKTPFLNAIIETYEESHFKKKGIRPQLRPTNEL